MTDREQLLHLVDRARRGSIFDAELDQLADGITAMADRTAELETETTKLIRWHREDGTTLAKAEAAIARVQALPRTPQVQIQIHGVPGQADYNRGWSSAISAARAALDEQHPTT
ncbi:hypothetical protein OG978_33640 [Streptomyces sp. NBC_01591]|uniref:hypothetical protein n=1 Tax=Streptomyces sp. NBC_01591 TaxID=2975888 RepID=UPI002DD9C271|nr:hypothetical protein [Streptomyces sp. NBC_01591]WSD71905.1 hypothetical protein OG978_33640 [Streptomyces sp. NBC_01591]